MNGKSFLTLCILVQVLIFGSFNSFAGVQLSKKDLIYLGAFRVPKGTYGVGTFGNNPYVAAQYQPLTYNPANNSLFLGKMTYTEYGTKAIGEISIPKIINPLDVEMDVTKLNTATVIQNIADISSGSFDKIMTGGSIPPEDSAKTQLGGLYVFDNRLYGTVWSYYDASGSVGIRSHWTANLNWTSGYGFDGIHSVGTPPAGTVQSNGGFVGGNMVEIPDKYKAALGYPLLTGRSGGPIISRSSYGPTLWGFDPNTFKGDIPAHAEMFIGYDNNHQTLGTYSDNPSLYFTRGTGIKGFIWPEGTDSILVFGGSGYGVEHDENGAPISNSGGTCTGPGTSTRYEAVTNSWLVANYSGGGYICGYTTMSASDISGGNACCFNPEDPSDKTHNLGYSVGHGQSCYGPGTDDWSEARLNQWLVANSPSGYQCGTLTMSAEEISAGDGCCYRGSGPQDKGGNAYPSVYQVWQYDVDDLLAVKNGTAKPYEIMPTIWNFDLPLDPDPSKHPKSILGVTYDKKNKYLYVGQAFGDGNYPLIHVFKIRPFPPKLRLID